MQQYSLQMWEYIFQVIEAKAINNPMLSPEGVRRAKVGDKKPLHQPEPLVEPITDNLWAEDGIVITSWVRAWYHRDQEERRMLRDNMETSFNDLLNINALIGRETKDG